MPLLWVHRQQALLDSQGSSVKGKKQVALGRARSGHEDLNTNRTDQQLPERSSTFRPVQTIRVQAGNHIVKVSPKRKVAEASPVPLDREAVKQVQDQVQQAKQRISHRGIRSFLERFQGHSPVRVPMERQMRRNTTVLRTGLKVEQGTNFDPNKYKVICTFLKDEDLMFLDEWVELHMAMGFDRIVMYDWDSPHHIVDHIKRDFVPRGVELLPVDMAGKKTPLMDLQISCIENCVKRYWERASVIAVIDVNEFIFPSRMTWHTPQPLVTALRDVAKVFSTQRAQVMQIHCTKFGTNEWVENPPGNDLIAAYPRRAPFTKAEYDHFKLSIRLALEFCNRVDLNPCLPRKYQMSQKAVYFPNGQKEVVPPHVRRPKGGIKPPKHFEKLYLEHSSDRVHSSLNCNEMYLKSMKTLRHQAAKYTAEHDCKLTMLEPDHSFLRFMSLVEDTELIDFQQDLMAKGLIPHRDIRNYTELKLYSDKARFMSKHLNSGVDTLEQPKKCKKLLRMRHSSLFSLEKSRDETIKQVVGRVKDWQEFKESHSELLAKPRIICTVIKNEERFLREWIDFHLLSGLFHKIIFYDHGSTDRSREIIESRSEERV